jgi:capsular polysaccharide biosynthesis protein
MLASFFRSFHIVRWLLIFFAALALSVLYGAYFTFLVLPKVYFGTAVIEVVPRDSESSLEPEAKFMHSTDFLLPVIDDLDLDKIWAKRVYETRLEALPAEYALSYMRTRVRIDLNPGTNIINIRGASTVSKEAADIANAIADRYKTGRETEGDPRNVVQILSRAVTAENPSLPTPIGEVLELILAAIKGVFIGLVLATFVEILFWYGPRTIVARQGEQAPQNPSDQY